MLGARAVMLVFTSILGQTACSDSDQEATPSGLKCGAMLRVLIDVMEAIPNKSGLDGHTAPLIAVDSEHVYFILQWTVAGSIAEDWRGYLMRTPVGGGAVERLASLPNGSVHMTQGLALTDSRVVFIQAPAEDEGNATVVAMPLNGGAISILAEARGRANAVLVDERNAYFADAAGVKAVSLSGGEPRVLVADVVALALAITTERIYLALSDAVLSVALEGGDLTTEAGVGGVALVPCGNAICWVGGTSALMASLMKRAPGHTPATLARGVVQPHDVAFDQNMFYIAGGRGVISRVVAEGGDLVTAYGEPGLTSLDIANDCLYWASVAHISDVSLETARTTDIEKMLP
jgi:hypothetical protein